MKTIIFTAATTVLLMMGAQEGFAQDDSGDTSMSFFITSAGPGDGADLGGLEGGGDNPTSWNSAHGSSGCSQQDLQGTGGNGLFYCFAID